MRIQSLCWLFQFSITQSCSIRNTRCNRKMDLERGNILQESQLKRSIFPASKKGFPTLQRRELSCSFLPEFVEGNRPALSPYFTWKNIWDEASQFQHSRREQAPRIHEFSHLWSELAQFTRPHLEVGEVTKFQPSDGKNPPLGAGRWPTVAFWRRWNARSAGSGGDRRQSGAMASPGYGYPWPSWFQKKGWNIPGNLLSSFFWDDPWSRIQALWRVSKMSIFARNWGVTIQHGAKATQFSRKDVIPGNKRHRSAHLCSIFGAFAWLLMMIILLNHGFS